MYSIRLALYTAAGFFVVLGILNILYMTEDHFQKVPHTHSIWHAYIHQFTDGLRHIKTNHVLRIMFIVMLFFGLYSEGIDRTYEYHILNNLGFRNMWDVAPIWILSIISAVVVLLGFIVLHVTKRYIKESHHVTMWVVAFTTIMMIGVLLFGFLPLPYLAVGGFMLFSIAREATYPLLDTILLKQTPSSIKATVLSTFGQLDAIGQIISGMIMMAIGLTLNISSIYLVTALLLLVPIILLPFTNKTSNS